MTIISRTVNDVVEGAFKLIGLFSEDRALENFRATEGLSYLQKILDNFGGVNTRIAYDAQLPFNLVLNQRTYTFSKEVGADVNSNKIVELKYVFLTDSDFNYPVDIENDDIFFNRRINLLSTGRPTQCFFQNALDETNSYEVSKITFFTLPDKAYDCTIKAKFVPNAVALSQPFDEVPNFYHLFLEYALGRELRNHYAGSNWDNEKELRYKELLDNVLAGNDLDLTTKTSTALKFNDSGYTYEDFRGA